MKSVPRQQATRTRKHQILDAALNCFLQQGVEATTIEQIRQASGASLGSIYHHFGSKEAIALAVYSEAFQQFSDHVLAQLATQKNLRTGLRTLVAAQLGWVEANADKFLYLSRVEMSDVSPPAAQHIAATIQNYFQAIYLWLQPYIDSGEVIRITPALYVPLILGPTSSFARHWLNHRLSLDLNDTIDTLAEAAWNSVRADQVKRSKN
jgi:AcrR family transcriptional regulator